MNIDIRTLFLVLGIVDVIQVIVFFLLYLVNRAHKGIGWWVLGSALSAAGLGLILLQDVVPIERISNFSAGALLIWDRPFSTSASCGSSIRGRTG
jgi:hypothetical protein